MKEKMTAETAKLSELFPAKKNVRAHPKKQIEELKKSLEMFGQFRPLVVTADGEILVGNGAYHAMIELGWEEAKIYRLPANITEVYKRKLMLADNKIFQLGADELMNIDEILSELPDFEVPGFDPDVLKDLYGSLDLMSEEKDRVGGIGKINPDAKESILRTAAEMASDPQPEHKEVEPDESVDRYVRNTGVGYINCPHCGVKIWLQ